SSFFLLLYFSLWHAQKTGLSDALLIGAVSTVIQSLLLVPCWRAWMLRRWACFLLSFILVTVNVLSSLFHIWAGMIVFLFTTTLLGAVIDENLNLKSGF
ncbi:MAG TPA: hypothetical protein VGB77_21235, partial [Abditibacteriaceae bacterium]